MEGDDLALLKEEYFHLQRTVEDFDQRALTIKSWSVTTSMVGIATAFLQDQAVLFLLSSLASLLFWLIEALWKEFQQCYYPRIRAIERALADQAEATERPLQIASSWSKSYHAYDLQKLLRIMVWPHVALPHAIIVVGGISAWIIPILCVAGSTI